MRRILSVVVLFTLDVGFCCPEVIAYKQFQDQWYEVYLADHPDEDYVKLVRKKAKCYICHQGKKKSDCNPYGARFVGLLEKRDKGEVEKIVAALTEVGQQRFDDKDDMSPTFNELVAQSKLPGGELEELKKPIKKGTDAAEKDKKEKPRH